ncbi:hypothetical protein A167_02368 [Alcanivorax sp. S71-1-4]|uniref:hypothetical protein n=1 Tax=Alcanivorax sp. S71-1-4 TaxID=1177159 RepID=UPI00169A42D1|nr:hypothetical protein [Alcanivorax sp. S71-1-4]KAF0808901.1 hypothetical protein A167_02368 [Alcanivorax sp. S71-1-4]
MNEMCKDVPAVDGDGVNAASFPADKVSRQSGGGQKPAVYGSYRPLRKITPLDLQQMYEIFCHYYHNTSLDLFLRDLSKKQGLFLIRRRSDQRIVGFSTLAVLTLRDGRRTVRGVFSGDTIIEREYWGSRALQTQFFLRMLWLRVRYPFTPLFWLLISKGYKTYLLLANNFFRFYPNPAGDDPRHQSLVEQYCEHMFPGSYDPQRRLLDFGDDYQRLRENVADITDDMRERFPRIAFFETRNPSWRQGTELPCLGQLGYSDLLRYLFRFVAKQWRASEGRSVATPAAGRGAR